VIIGFCAISIFLSAVIFPDNICVFAGNIISAPILNGYNVFAILYQIPKDCKPYRSQKSAGKSAGRALLPCAEKKNPMQDLLTEVWRTVRVNDMDVENFRKKQDCAGVQKNIGATILSSLKNAAHFAVVADICSEQLPIK
jgi:hypothetical protein